MELMKNGLGSTAIDRIAKAFIAVCPEFKIETFQKKATINLESLELKERVEHIIESLSQSLPGAFLDHVEYFNKIKPVWDHGDPQDPLASFAAWPVTDYIAKHGLDYPEQSLETLKYLTSLFSSEFAIRPFILKYPELCQKRFSTWITDEDEHVRRLVSEGTRPRLPWGIRLKPFIESPATNLPWLDSLYKDDSLYVRRSVANHLNDIAKDHPDLVADTCERWLNPECKNTTWVIKHAARTLIKEGHTKAMKLQGFTENPKVKLNNLVLSEDKIMLGKSLSFSFNIDSMAKTDQKLVIDFAIHFMKANGKQKRKMFKLKSFDLAGKQNLVLAKQFSFKPITTRKYYPGDHLLEIFVNGQSYKKVPFIVCE